LKKLAPALLLTLDCGISNFKEIKLAKKMGFETLIIDHHETLDELPKASLIVDPKQKKDKYPFKGLATAGIIFKLSQLLLADKFTDPLRKDFLELVALATIADMMPEQDENKIMIEEGLTYLKNTWRPGLKVFFGIDGIGGSESIRGEAQKIISALNIAEQKEHLNATYLLLTTDSLKEAEVLAIGLLDKRNQKQAEIRNIGEEIEGRLFQKGNESIIFEGNYSWPISLLGSISSRLCRKYKKPAFIFKMQEKESRGAVRMPQGKNSVELMKKCKKYLITFGGHAPASGFTMKNENLDKFKTCLIENYDS
jgi:single-stranded-DNA-specific exonuclease